MTLEFQSNVFFDLFFKKLTIEEKSDEKSEDEEKSGLKYESLYLSLGFYFISFVFLLLMLIAYGVISLGSQKIKFCRKIQLDLQNEVFWNFWIRYLLESYLKITHYCTFYLYITGSFE